MQSRAIVFFIAWISLVCACAAQTVGFPVLTGRVVDEAGLLNATLRMELTESLAELEAKTTDQLVIVTLKSLQGTSIEDYGYQLGRRWQVGQKDKNNGVLLIVAPNERQVRIEVGYGLEGTLTDAISKIIIENSILPRFKAGDLVGGIKRGVEDIVQVLSGDAEEWKRRAIPSTSSNDARPGTTDSVWPAILIMVVGAGLLIYCATTGGAFCQILLLMLLSGRRGSSRSGSSWSGGGGSFGGGGASGRW